MESARVSTNGKEKQSNIIIKKIKKKSTVEKNMNASLPVAYNNIQPTTHHHQHQTQTLILFIYTNPFHDQPQQSSSTHQVPSTAGSADRCAVRILCGLV